MELDNPVEFDNPVELDDPVELGLFFFNVVARHFNNLDGITIGCILVIIALSLSPLCGTFKSVFNITVRTASLNRTSNLDLNFELNFELICEN